MLAGAVTWLLGRRIAAIGDLPALIGAVLLIVWSLQRIGGFWMPVLPTPLPIGVERIILGSVIGSAVAAAGVVLQRRLAPAVAPLRNNGESQTT